MWVLAFTAVILLAGGLPTLNYPVRGSKGAERLYEIFKKAREKECPAYFFYDEKKNVVEIQGERRCLDPIKEEIEAGSASA